MLDRIIRAVRLDSTLYREVAGNPALTTEATIIAIVTAVIGSLGVLFTPDRNFMAYVLQVLNSILLGWVLWSVVTYFVGNAFGGRSSIPEMLRTLGYATAPRLLGLFGFIPCLGWLASLAGAILSLVAGIIAIRESMEFDTGKALITAVIGFVIYLIVSIIISLTLAAVTLPFSG